MRALKMAGRLIPKDVTIVGINDFSFAGYFSPAPTSIRASIEEAGREAARQLAHLMSGEQTEVMTLMHTKLVIHE